jgi:hypothetical protein
VHLTWDDEKIHKFPSTTKGRRFCCIDAYDGWRERKMMEKCVEN